MEEVKVEEVQTLNLSRQSKLVPEDRLKEYCIKIFGVGSVGSHFAKVMAKTGFKKIEVFDNDIVEEENIAAQAYDFKHLGMKKVEAIAQICKEASGIDVITHHGLVLPETKIEAAPNTIYCCFFDSFEGRKMVFDKLKDYPVIFVDGRIGRYDMRYYIINFADKEKVKEYGETLEVTGVSDLECGEKACAPINVQIAGMMTMNLINLISDKDYVEKFIGNAAMPKNNIIILKQITFGTSDANKPEGEKDGDIEEVFDDEPEIENDIQEM